MSKASFSWGIIPYLALFLISGLLHLYYSCYTRERRSCTTLWASFFLSWLISQTSTIQSQWYFRFYYVSIKQNKLFLISVFNLQVWQSNNLNVLHYRGQISTKDGQITSIILGTQKRCLTSRCCCPSTATKKTQKTSRGTICFQICGFSTMSGAPNRGRRSVCFYCSSPAGACPWKRSQGVFNWTYSLVKKGAKLFISCLSAPFLGKIEIGNLIYWNTSNLFWTVKERKSHFWPQRL